MFDKISFFSYQFKKPLTSTDSVNDLEVLLKKQLLLKKSDAWQDIPDNIRDADFSLPNKIDIFSRPPVKDFAVKNLYHVEAFSIFYCKKNFYTKRKNYNSYLILYTYEGHGFLEYEGKSYPLSAGDGFLIDCRLPHLYRTEGSYWIHSVLHLNGPLMPSLFEEYMQNGSIVFTQPVTGNYQTCLEKLLTIYTTSHPCRDWQASDCISNIMTHILNYSYSYNTNNSPVPETLQYLIKYMESNFSSAITLDYLSKFSGISKYYLSREFKKYTGFSPNDYLIQLRVEHAKTLLQSTTLPANKIAHIVGVHDLNNFNNLFKKKTGMTPGQYRKVTVIY